jgi:acetylglutamate kinase
VERVLADETNEAIVSRIEELGGRAAPLNFRHNTNVLFGRRLALHDDRGAEVDLGYVGATATASAAKRTIPIPCCTPSPPGRPASCWPPGPSSRA